MFLSFSLKGFSPSQLGRPRGRSVKQLVITYNQEAESGQEVHLDY